MLNQEKRRSRSQPLLFVATHRRWLSAAFVVLVAFLAVRHYVLGGGPAGKPELCAYCPMGGLASLYVFVVHGQFLRHIHPTSIIVLAAVLAVTLFSRRAFCGWICPFGTIQEWLASLGGKFLGGRREPPVWLDRKLRYLKYGIGGAVVGASWYLGTLVFRRFDPYLAAFDYGENPAELWPGYLALGVVVVGSLFVSRFWCRYACPLGALLGLMSKIGLMKISHEEGVCRNCKAGIRRCPMGINPTLLADLRSAECIHCMECVAACPFHNAVHVEAFGKRMRPAWIGAAVAGSFLLVIGASQYLGAWQTLHGRQRSASVWSDQADTRSRMVTGSMTLADVSQMYGVDSAALRRILGIGPGIPVNREIRDLRRAGTAGVPAPDEIERALDAYISRGAGVGGIGGRVASRPSTGVRTPAQGFPEQRSGRRTGRSASNLVLNGASTLQEALAYSGKTLDQVKRDWNLEFVDPQTNLGALAKMIGIPMRELRDYFSR